MEPNELRNLIEEVLGELATLPSYPAINRKEAVELLMGTCAQESHLGKYRKQIGGGPALGIYQMEPATFGDIVKNYLSSKPVLREKIMEVSGVKEFNSKDLVQNDRLSTCMARVHYLRVKEGIPSSLDGQARYWKKYYNTPLGAGTEQEYMSNYKKLVI